MRMTTMMAAAMLVLASAPALATLDCARVKELSKGGARASEIARTLGITTPDVQACLADAVEEPVMAHPAGKIPLAPQRPVADGVIRRAPDGQNE
jgi:predicted transcriptional regulator